MSSPVKSPPSVACPTCGKATLFSPENRFRPFCSERCKLIDLGQWATDSYGIPLAENDTPETGPETPN